MYRGRGVDLNLIPVLRALLDEGSVTGAARSLGMSQPAMSNALARLRAVLKDPLLVRVGRTMRLTPRAERLRPELERACLGLEALFLDQAFDPRTSKRQFTVAAPDYMALLLGPYLMDRLLSDGPGMTLRLISAGDDLFGAVAASDVDIAVVAHTSMVGHGLCICADYADRMVGVVAADHPLARDPPCDLSDLDAWPWIGADIWRTMFTPGDALWSIIRQAAERTTLSLSYLLLLPMIAAQTRGVAFVPKALADTVEGFVPITQFEIPGKAGHLGLCQIWSPLLDADPGHRWFRSVLSEAMARHFQRQ